MATSLTKEAGVVRVRQGVSHTNTDPASRATAGSRKNKPGTAAMTCSLAVPPEGSETPHPKNPQPKLKSKSATSGLPPGIASWAIALKALASRSIPTPSIYHDSRHLWLHVVETVACAGRQGSN